jgi:integrase
LEFYEPPTNTSESLALSTGSKRRHRQPKGLLTDAKIRALITPEEGQQKSTDGNGLYMLVKATGLRAWCWDYTFARKKKTLRLGRYPDVSLAEARSARDAARKMLRSGVDPSEERKAIKLASMTALENSFESLARAWWEVWRTNKHERYAANVISTLERHIFRKLGSKPISQVEPMDLAKVVEAAHAAGAKEIAKRIPSTCGMVFRYAILKGIAKRNPAADFKPQDVLPSRPVKHHARLDVSELPELLRKIDAYQGTPVTRLAVKLMALTFVRTSELIGAKWTEFDMERGEWRIPPERMKMKTLHIVPLAPQALSLLRTLQTVSGHREHLFPGDRAPKQPISNNTILKALERMGYRGRMTGHGFRGMASTYLHEQQFPSDHIELQLAHVKRNKVSAAYDWAKHLPQRRAMMEHWATHLDECLKEG